MYHTTAWLIWLLLGIMLALVTTNPLYLILILTAVFVNFRVLGRRSALVGVWWPLIKIAVILALAAALINPLLVHEGETVLFFLPQWRLLVGPDQRIALITLGGPVTLEAFVLGITKGMGLMSTIFVFATFNILVDTSRLLRSLPKFMYQTGVVTSIAVSFVPQTMFALKEIREAQMVRGHRFRGIRDLLPLFLPLLTTGFERAMQLAESMEARGFGSRREITSGQEVTYKGLVALALVLLVAAVSWLGFGTYARWLGYVLVAVSVFLLLGVFRSMGRRVRRSRYVREIWRQRDTVLTTISAIALGVFLIFNHFDIGSIHYYPYPKLSWPGFDPIIGLVITMLVSPVVLLGRPRKRRSPVGMSPSG